MRQKSHGEKERGRRIESLSTKDGWGSLLKRVHTQRLILDWWIDSYIFSTLFLKPVSVCSSIILVFWVVFFWPSWKVKIIWKCPPRSSESRLTLSSTLYSGPSFDRWMENQHDDGQPTPSRRCLLNGPCNNSTQSSLVHGDIMGDANDVWIYIIFLQRDRERDSYVLK